MKTSKSPLQVHQMTLAQLDAQFPHDEACKAYLMVNRWPDGVTCPRCGNANVYDLSTRPFHWQCHACAPQGYRFSVLVGTIFENTNKPLRDWFKVLHMMVTSKKGVSALQVARVMGFGSYKTAHMMCSKIRVAMGNTEFQQLVGYVEVDETFVGGKAHNKHRGPGGKGDGGGRGGHGKEIIIGAVKRKGNVIACVMESTRREVLEGFVKMAVAHDVSLISTDEFGGYARLKKQFPHGVVNHSHGQYVHRSIHTNTIEGFWSLIKRGIMGTFHEVSAKYLPIYVSEFEFRYNNRKNPDIFGAALRQTF